MVQKIAVAILHGAGTPEENFAEEMIEKISEGFGQQVNKENIVFQPIFWSEIFESGQEKLWEKVQTGGDLNYEFLRRFVVEFLADTVAYQPAPALNGQNYDKVHALLSQNLSLLREKAGPHAPLCVISESLGSVVATNYFYDLQKKQRNIGKRTERYIEDTPLEKGETLNLFYTLGSPLALWSLRFNNFGEPINVPAPSVHQHYPNLGGEWLNFYDKNDILAYPLKELNSNYQKAVTKDIEVNAGGLLTSWNPFSHTKYDTNDYIIDRIVDGLLSTWSEINE
ncbi:hypothetical protein [Salinicoccus albus]|uniref:hypothetical protein n=1 Tax=Salinicoccus albus TaxID=418756 RepID=UPI00035DE11C|nr:hypothetical protein [Salinicoccus albus]